MKKDKSLSHSAQRALVVSSQLTMAPTSTLLLSGPWWWLCASLILISWISITSIRRRYFHPLSHVLGPFLWSISHLPVFYHNGIREGQLMHVLSKLHVQYGMCLPFQKPVNHN